MCLFHFCRCCCRIHHIPSWIHFLRQTLDSTTFSTCIPSLKSNYHRNPSPIHFSVQFLYFLLQLLQSFFVFFFSISQRQICPGENGWLKHFQFPTCLTHDFCCFLLTWNLFCRLNCLFLHTPSLYSFYRLSKCMDHRHINLYCRKTPVGCLDHSPRCRFCITSV